jgi:hypothetical protein
MKEMSIKLEFVSVIDSACKAAARPHRRLNPPSRCTQATDPARSHHLKLLPFLPSILPFHLHSFWGSRSRIANPSYLPQPLTAARKRNRSSWYESGTAFLGKAKSSCKASASHFGKTAGGWTERWALPGYQGTARQSSYGSHLQNMMRGRTPSSTMGDLVRGWAAAPHRLYTQCTGNRRTDAASRSETYDEE